MTQTKNDDFLSPALIHIQTLRRFNIKIGALEANMRAALEQAFPKGARVAYRAGRGWSEGEVVSALLDNGNPCLLIKHWHRKTNNRIVLSRVRGYENWREGDV